LDVVPWLMKLAIEHIDSEIDRTREERENLVSLDEVLPDVPLINKVPTQDQQDRDSYLSDLDLDLEEIFPGVSLPSEEPARRAMRHEARDLLMSRTDAWRRAFVLHYIERLSTTEVAHVIGVSEEEIQRYLASAREYVQQNLLESGSVQSAESNPNSKAEKAVK